ncbi:MAG: PAS domain S-box protein [Ignavibacteriaceae bacterium]
MESKIKLNNNSGILIVEDSPTQLEQLQHSLETHDYKVITAVNGKLGLEAARKHSPAIIISDILMPEMNGYELCKAIRSDENLKDTPIVLLTSLSSPADVIEALKCGADNFIRKPYDEQNLLLRIDNILTNKKLRSNNKVKFGVEISLGGDRHFITAERQQILDLLISTYEQAVELCGTLKIREQQIGHTNETLRGIYQIAKGLNSAMTRQAVIEHVLDRALELPDVRAGWFSVLEGESNFKLAGSRGLPPALEVPGAMEGDCLCRRKVLAGEINRSMNITECERLKKAKGETYGLRSHVTIPLKSGNHIFGILNLVGTEQVLFNDDDLAVLNGIGSQIGAALDRCLIHEHLEELVEERTAALTVEIIERQKAEESVKKLNRIYAVLSNINHTIVRTRDLKTLYREACRIAVETGNLHIAHIALIDKAVNKLEIAGYAEMLDPAIKGLDTLLQVYNTDENPAILALRSGMHIVFNDIEHDPLAASWRSEILRLGCHSAAVFPLTVHGEIRGVFGLSSSETDFFDEDEIKLLDELAMDISFAMEVAEKEQKRLQAEEALRESEERFRFMAEKTGDALYRLKYDAMKYDYISPAVQILTGYTAEEINSIGFLSIVKEVETTGETSLKTLIENRKKDITNEYRADYLIQTKLGELKWLGDHSFPWRDDSGNIIGSVGILTDITERKKAEEQIHMLAHMVKSINQCVSITDKEDKIIFVNEAFLKTYGYEEHELIGKPISIVRSPNNTPEVVERILPATITDGWNGELLNLRKDGSEFPIYLTTSVIKDANGNPIGHSGVATDITERKQAEEALRKSEERFRSLYINATIGIYRTTPDGKILMANPALVSMLGYTSFEELKKRDLKKEGFEQSYSRELFIEPIEKYGEIRGVESLWKRKDGKEIWVSESARAIRNSKGETLYYDGIIENITERKQAEEALQRSEEKYRSIFESAIVGIYQTTLDGRYLSANPTHARIFGYESPEDLMESVSDLNRGFYVKPGRREEFIRLIQEQGAVTNFESQVYRKDGSIIWISETARGIRNVNNQLVGFEGVTIDISQRKHSGEERARLVSILESTTDFVGIANANLQVIYLNKAGRKMVGINEDEDLNFPIGQVYSEWERKKLTDKALPAVMLEGVWNGEMALLTRDGSEVTVSQVIIAHKSPEGKLEFLSTIIRDITEQKQAEQDLIKAKELAELSNKLKDAFIANISHEIRTPLNGILGMTSLIKESLAQYASEEDEEGFNAIDSSSKRIIRTVDMILNFSRLQVGEFSTDKELLNLPSIINNLISEYRSTAVSKSLELTFENKSGDGNLIADIYCITHAISNLIDNALKYTRKGYVKVVLYKDEKGNLKLDVQDSGIGIAEEYLKHLFEPYTQEKIGYSRPYEGIGLGLSLVKKFLDLNSAPISVVSKKGEGTTFTIHFNRSTTDKQEKTKVVKKSELIKEPTQEQQVKKESKPLILIVEDDEINQNALRLILSKKYKTVVVPSASEALEALRTNPIELILMDISIKGEMNGLELTTLIKKTPEYSGIPVIAVTAHAFSTDRQNSLDAGCDEYISKPFEIKELFEKISKLMSINI